MDRSSRHPVWSCSTPSGAGLSVTRTMRFLPCSLASNKAASARSTASVRSSFSRMSTMPKLAVNTGTPATAIAASRLALAASSFGRVGRGAIEQGPDELLTPVAADQVLGRNDCAASWRTAPAPGPRWLAVGVVERFEMVQVGHGQGHRAAPSARAPHLLLE